MVERLNSKFSITASGRIIPVFGEASDYFILPNLQLAGLDQLMWYYLIRENHFDSVAFYDAVNGLFALDPQTAEALGITETGRRQDAQSPDSIQGFVLSGEWNSITVPSPQPQQELQVDNPGIKGGRYLTRQYDWRAFEMMDLLVQQYRKTAIIVLGYDSLFLSRIDLREKFNQLVDSWNRDMKARYFKLFLVFNKGSQEDVIQAIRNYSNESLSLLIEGPIDTPNLKDRSYWRIGPPFGDENKYLVHRMRIMEGNVLEWEQLSNILFSMDSFGFSLSKYHDLLDKVKNIRIPNLNAELSKWGKVEGDDKKYKIPNNRKPALEQLNELIGLENVKETIAQYIKTARFKKRDARFSKVAYSFHLMFTGNPGTGKTEVARLVAQIFREEQIIPNCKFNQVSGADLIEEHIGGTAKRTREQCEKAIPGVLFIDEAYAIADSDFGKECMNILIQYMLNYQDQFAVIFAGYQADLHRLFALNEGLKSRIGEERIIHFKDYSIPELMGIFRLKTKDLPIVIEPGAEKHFKQYIERKMRHSKDFGNARGIENIIKGLNEIVTDKPILSGHNEKYQITLADVEHKFPLGRKQKPGPQTESEALLELERMPGMREIAKKIRQQIYLIKRRLESKGDDNIPRLHWQLVGNPGTGKTTVARLIAKAYFELGLIKNASPVETNPGDITQGFVGQSEKRMEALCKEAKGGVLFIDEVHGLADGGAGGSGGFGATAVKKVLLPFMENHREDFILIVASYPKDMDRFLAIDPGIDRRFGGKIMFDDFDPETLLAIFDINCKKNHLFLEEGLHDSIRRIIEGVYQNKDRSDKPFGNAGWVENFVQELESKFVTRCYEEKLDAHEELVRKADLPEYCLIYLSGQNELQAPPIRLVLPRAYPVNWSMPASLKDAVCCIEVEKSTATGFVINSEGHLITCSHAIAKSKQVTVIFDGNAASIIADVLLNIRELDFALLKLRHLPPRLSYCVLAGPTTQISEMAPVFSRSYPLGKRINNHSTVYSGEINGMSMLGNQLVLQTNLEATHGSSGAPVFQKKDNKVIGYIVGGIHEQQTRAAAFNFAADIRQFFQLKELSILFQTEI